MISIRRITEKDSKLVFEWRNSPMIKRLSTSQSEVSWKEHLNWVRDSLNNPQRLVFLITVDGKEVGQLRFDRDKNETDIAQVSIYLIEHFIGKQIGKQALLQGLNQLRIAWVDCRIVEAHVRTENFKSQRFFQKSGFFSKENHKIKNHFSFRLEV